MGGGGKFRVVSWVWRGCGAVQIDTTMGSFEKQVKKFKEALEAAFKSMPSGDAKEEEVNMMVWAEQYVSVKVSLLINVMFLD